MSSETWALEIRDVLKAPGVPDGIHYTALELFGDRASAVDAVPVPVHGWGEVAETGFYGKVVGKAAALTDGADSGYRVYRLDPNAKLGPVKRRQVHRAQWRGPIPAGETVPIGIAIEPVLRGLQDKRPTRWNPSRVLRRRTT